MKNKFLLVIVVILVFTLFSKAQTPVAKCDSLPFYANNVPLGGSLISQTFTLKNAGGDTLTVTDTTSLNSSPWWRSNVKPATIHLANGETKTFTFSFVPTVIGPKQMTYVITTNGGTITIHLLGNGVDCSPITGIWTESFESTIFPPACWTISNPDGGTGWNKVSNNTSPLPGWADGTITLPPGGGTKAAYCTRKTGGATYNNQYLITKQFLTTIHYGLVFSVFWHEHYQDFLDIKVSTTTNDAASFTNTIFTIDTTQLIYGSWKNFVIPIFPYAGQNIYIAFVEHVPNNTTQGAFIGIDLVWIEDIDIGIKENSSEIISVFPNPANDKIYITAENVKSVEVFNILGENFGSYGHVKEINVSNLTQGFYFVKVITDSKTVTKKINIVR